MKIGYFLSCEEYAPDQLIEQATLAEESGFDALWISDHFHPWNDQQGESPLVWSIIGAISQVCDLGITTAVTCPTMRIQPTIVAQAAATSAVLCKGGFKLGVGSGEALNEHIHGQPWPSADIRLDMLEEAVAVMRELWTGEFVNHYGRYFTVDSARIYTLPESPPEIYISGFGPKSVSLAAKIGDGYITTSPDPELLSQFRSESGGKPTTAGFKVGWAPTQAEGVQHAHRLWANSGIPGELAQVLPSPRHFEQAMELVTEDMTRETVTCGSDVDAHVAGFDKFLEAGFDEIYVANMGPHYRDMIETYGREVLPRVRQRAA